jgi:hypothetical protein
MAFGSSVVPILRWRRKAKIRFAIVERVAVYVVDFKTLRCAENEPME